MNVVFPMPDQQQLFNFVYQSNELALVPIDINEIMQTFHRKALHPGASGHFAGIQFTLENARKPIFPVRHAVEFHDETNSYKNLEWLRKLHSHIMKPIAKYGDSVHAFDAYINLSDCGNFRVQPANLAGRILPKPTSINRLMHWWHKDLGEFHLKWLPKLNKPTTVTMEDTRCLVDEAYNKHIQLACIRPWIDGNGRTCRFMENMLRLRWGLPWKTYFNKNKLDYVRDIMKYEDSTTWQTILQQNS